MSNNKHNMKLYTEEEIVSFLKKEFADEIDPETFMKNLTTIELPNDEEIEKWAEMQSLIEPTGAEEFGRIWGAKWMRDKTQGGNNEQQ